MALHTKKLYYRRGGTTYSVDLYTTTAEVGSEYLTLRDGSIDVYAKIDAVGSTNESFLRVHKSGIIKSLISTIPVAAPPPISGYSIWLDSSSIDNFVLSGNAVITWKDSSNNGRDLSAPLESRRPLYTSDRLGFPTVVFNTPTRATHMLKASANVIDYATSYTFFIVHDYSGFSSSTVLNYQTSCFAQGTDAYQNVTFSTAYPGYNTGANDQPLLDTYPPFGGGLRLNTKYTINTRYITMGVSDAVTRTLKSSSGDTATNAAEVYTGPLTPEFVLGNLVPSGSVHMYMGGINEVVVYNTAFTTEQINTTMSALASKWNVPLA